MYPSPKYPGKYFILPNNGFLQVGCCKYFVSSQIWNTIILFLISFVRLSCLSMIITTACSFFCTFLVFVNGWLDQSLHWSICQRSSSIYRFGLEVIKLCSCSTQLSMKFDLLINFKLLKIANCFFLKIAEHEIFSANQYEIANYCWHIHIY